MKNNLSIILKLLPLLILNSCLPEDRLWWSPDGGTALIRTEDGIHIVEPGKKPDPRRMVTGGKEAAWLPKGEGFLAVREIEVPDWKSVEKLIPAEEAEAVRKFSQVIPGILRTLVEATGEGINNTLDALPINLGEEDDLLFYGNFAIRRAFEEHGGEMRKAVDLLPEEERTDILKLADEPLCLRQLALVTISGDGELPARALLHSLKHIDTPLPHPTGTIAAVRRGGELLVVSLDAPDRDPILVSKKSSTGVAWTNDGLAYMLPVGDPDANELRICRLQVRRMTDDKGALFDADHLPDPSLLLTTLQANEPRLATLPGNRLLTATVTASLPARPEQLYGKLVVIDVASSSTRAIETPKGALPVDPSAFVVNAEGTMVAVVEYSSHAVTVVEIATAMTTLVAGNKTAGKTEVMPAWRENDRLVFALMRDGRSSLQEWTLGAGSKRLETSWPEKWTTDWLSPKQGD